MPQPGEGAELLVGDRVQRPDLAAVVAATAGRARRRCSWPSGRGAASSRGPRRTRSVSVVRTDERRCLAGRRAAAAAEPTMEAALLLGEDADREVDPGDEPIQGRSEQPAPVIADIAELAGERSPAIGEPALAGARAATSRCPAYRRPAGRGDWWRSRRGDRLDQRPLRQDADRRPARGVIERPDSRWRGGRGAAPRGVAAARVVDAGKGVRRTSSRRVVVRARPTAARRSAAPRAIATSGWRRAASSIARWAASWRRLSARSSPGRGCRAPGDASVLSAATMRRAAAGGSGPSIGATDATSSRVERGAKEGHRAPSAECGTSEACRPSRSPAERIPRAPSACRDGLGAARSRRRARSMRRSSSSPAGSNSYDQRPDALGPVERASRGRSRSPRATAGSRRRSDRSVEIAVAVDRRRQRARRRSCPTAPASRAMFSAPRSEAQTSPTREPAGSAGDLVDELEVARPDEHRDDRHAPVDERLRLVGMERRGRDEVVVEPVEPLGQVVEKRALDVDQVAGTRRRAAPRRSRRRRSCIRRTGPGPAGPAASARSRRRMSPRRPRRRVNPAWAARRSISATMPGQRLARRAAAAAARRRACRRRGDS